MEIDAYFGYFPEPSKCKFIVQNSLIAEAASVFERTGVEVVTSCQFLGGCIGDASGVTDFVFMKSQEWAHYVELLSSIAVDQPQAAYIALTKSLQNEWTLLQRVIPDCCHLFLTLSLFYHLFSFQL